MLINFGNTFPLKTILYSDALNVFENRNKDSIYYASIWLLDWDEVWCDVPCEALVGLVGLDLQFCGMTEKCGKGFTKVKTFRVFNENFVKYGLLPGCAETGKLVDSFKHPIPNPRGKTRFFDKSCLQYLSWIDEVYYKWYSSESRPKT